MYDSSGEIPENGTSGIWDGGSKELLGEEEKKDSDGDWILDYEDICPLVKWLKENDWCPIFDTKCDINNRLISAKN